jgi:hypothetical protein
MFTKKDIYFSFRINPNRWIMSVGRWSQTSHFDIARPSQKPNRDSQDTFIAFANREAQRDAKILEAEKQRQTNR